MRVHAPRLRAHLIRPSFVPCPSQAHVAARNVAADVYPGAPRRSIVLDEARMVHKIVREHRGGFCYELNSSFGWLLRQLGFQVERLSARMNTIVPDVFGPPFDHLCLRVNGTWLCDVTASYAMGPLELRTAGRQPQRSHGVLYRLAECVTSSADKAHQLVTSCWRLPTPPCDATFQLTQRRMVLSQIRWWCGCRHADERRWRCRGSRVARGGRVDAAQAQLLRRMVADVHRGPT